MVGALEKGRGGEMLYNMTVTCLNCNIYCSISRGSLERLNITFLFKLVFCTVGILYNFLEVITGRRGHDFEGGLVILTILLINFVTKVVLPCSGTRRTGEITRSSTEIVRGTTMSRRITGDEIRDRTAADERTRSRRATRRVATRSNRVRGGSSAATSSASSDGRVGSFLGQGGRISRAFTGGLRSTLSLAKLNCALSSVD